MDTRTDDSEARNDFGSMEGDFIHRQHVEPRVQLHVPKEESFPLPLRYIDLIKRTQTTLDLLHESLVDDHWNVDVDRSLSDSCAGFTKFTLLNAKLPQRYMWSRERLTKNQLPDLTSNAQKCGPALSKAAQQKQKAAMGCRVTEAR